jgi:hypothetical protein
MELTQQNCCAIYTNQHYLQDKILSRVWVTKDGVRIGKCTYWILTARKYN